MTEDLTTRVRVLISKVLDRPLADIQPTTAFHDDLHLDDLEWIEMLLAMEEEWDLEILDEDAEGFKNVGDIASYLAARLGLIEVAA